MSSIYILDKPIPGLAFGHGGSQKELNNFTHRIGWSVEENVLVASHTKPLCSSRRRVAFIDPLLLLIINSIIVLAGPYALEIIAWNIQADGMGTFGKFSRSGLCGLAVSGP
jgi:hypothetical protein